EKSIALGSAIDPELHITADRTQVRQALANVVDNAIKYTAPHGRVDIRASRRNGNVDIDVADTGGGIPPEEIHRIWERLFRGKNGHGQKGLGLGLSLVKAIVASHRGDVTVKSEAGRGSVFTLSFPIERDPSKTI